MATGFGKSALDDLFKEVYADKMEELYSDFSKPLFSVDDWLKRDITEKDISKFPKAKAAKKLQNTKLYKALK
jgi:hypothetical protein